MLIKFLSFAASAILGSRRHKAVIISCSTVTLAITGVIGLTMYHNGGPFDAASTSPKNERASQEDTIWLHANEVDSKDQYAEHTEAETLPEESADEPGKPQQDKPGSGDTELQQRAISLSASQATLNPDSASDTLLAHISGGEPAEDWTVSVANTDENGDTAGLSITNVEKTGERLSFRIHTAKDVLPGTYRVTVRAMFAGNNSLPLSETLTVTIQQAANP